MLNKIESEQMDNLSVQAERFSFACMTLSIFCFCFGSIIYFDSLQFLFVSSSAICFFICYFDCCLAASGERCGTASCLLLFQGPRTHGGTVDGPLRPKNCLDLVWYAYSDTPAQRTRCVCVFARRCDACVSMQQQAFRLFSFYSWFKRLTKVRHRQVFQFHSLYTTTTLTSS